MPESYSQYTSILMYYCNGHQKNLQNPTACLVAIISPPHTLNKLAILSTGKVKGAQTHTTDNHESDVHSGLQNAKQPFFQLLCTVELALC